MRYLPLYPTGVYSRLATGGLLTAVAAVQTRPMVLCRAVQTLFVPRGTNAVDVQPCGVHGVHSVLRPWVAQERAQYNTVCA